MMSRVIRLYGLLVLINVILVVAALIDSISTEEDSVRNLPKIAWVLIILLFSPAGAIAWFVAGRPRHQPVGPGGAWRPGAGFPEPERPRTVAPDDDPEFLRGLAPRRREDEELLDRWETDLRRREEELRRRERGDAGD